MLLVTKGNFTTIMGISRIYSNRQIHRPSNAPLTPLLLIPDLDFDIDAPGALPHTITDLDRQLSSFESLVNQP